MPKFLNTQGISEWMIRIINETERELIIISPYLQLSDKIFQALRKADSRGVEIIFIYREKKINEHEKGKLLAIENLNLMHHPNIHAKCMLNENFLLLSSMNLYEYSEKNNREMGTLFSKKYIEEFHSGWHDAVDGIELFEEALEEIIEIKNGAEMERPSRETIEDCFEMEILKNEKEKKEEFVKKINKVFVHKKFILEGKNSYLCKSYIDKVDVLIDYKTDFILNYDSHKVDSFYKKSDIKALEYMIGGFKLYWNSPKKISLYDDFNHSLWKNANIKQDEIKLRKEGIDKVVKFIKENLID